MNKCRDTPSMTLTFELGPQIQHLLDQVPDVPALLEPEHEQAVISTEDPTQMMGLPLAWFTAAGDRHAVRVNRMRVGLHLALHGELLHCRELGALTRATCRRLVADVINRLERVDIDAVEVFEHVPKAPSPTEVVSRMDELIAGARRLNTTPRTLVAIILGRTLH